MLRKFAIFGATVALAISTLGTDAATARGTHVRQVAGKGAIGTCTLTGSITFTPGLVYKGTSKPETMKVAGKLSSCKGGWGDGANVRGGVFAGSAKWPGPNDCEALSFVGLPAFDLSIVWTSTKAKLLPTTVHIAAMPPSGLTMPDFQAPIGISLSGKAAAHTSFAGRKVQVKGITDGVFDDYNKDCATYPKGLTAFTFTGVHGRSTFTG